MTAKDELEVSQIHRSIAVGLLTGCAHFAQNGYYSMRPPKWGLPSSLLGKQTLFSIINVGLSVNIVSCWVAPT
jgi:hypothetical protein